jgi:hypothetical protein
MPHRRRSGEELPDWKQEHNRSHKQVRARGEHVFARMKTFFRADVGAVHALAGPIEFAGRVQLGDQGRLGGWGWVPRPGAERSTIGGNHEVERDTSFFLPLLFRMGQMGH